MAISKTQNERPSIIALIDLVNTLEESSNQHAQSIAGLVGDVDTLTRSQGALSSAVQGISDELGSGFDSNTTVAGVIGLTKWMQDFEGISLSESIDQLTQALAVVDGFTDRIKIGETETLTIPANDSYSSSLVFPVPFTDGDGCIVFLQVITDELATLFSSTLIDCTYSGFSYSISNTDADPHTVKLGYVAFRTNGN